MSPYVRKGPPHRRPSDTPATKAETDATERLQKVLATAGIASRRASEELIVRGRVQVNGVVVTELGTKVNPKVDDILVDGEPLPKLERFLYLLLNKPIGVHSTTSDERGRRTVLDLVPVNDRIYPVGRLDADSEGLILLTNDGPLTERMTHPRYGHSREYRVLVFGEPDVKALGRLRRGVVLEDGPTGPAEVEVLPQARLRDEHLPFPQGSAAWLKMVIREGRKRQIRRMCEMVGHPVMRLIRVGMGPLALGDLPTGAFRSLTDREIARLRESVGMGGRKRRPGQAVPASRASAGRQDRGAGESEAAPRAREAHGGRAEGESQPSRSHTRKPTGTDRREAVHDEKRPRRPRGVVPRRGTQPPQSGEDRAPRSEAAPIGRDPDRKPRVRRPRPQDAPATGSERHPTGRPRTGGPAAKPSRPRANSERGRGGRK